MISDEMFGQLVPFEVALHLKREIESLQRVALWMLGSEHQREMFRMELKKNAMKTLQDAGFTEKANERYTKEVEELNSKEALL